MIDRPEISYRAGYLYQLAEDYSVQTSIVTGLNHGCKFLELTAEGILTVFGGYAWDGPSGPTKTIASALKAIPLVGGWMYRKFLKSFMRGSLVHDALYQMMRKGIIDQDFRVDADKELHVICLADGMTKARAWWVYRGVRVGAGFAASPRSIKKVLTAP